MTNKKEVEIIEDEKEIWDIINSKIKNKKVIFTDWYEIGIMRKGISEEKFDEVFSQFEKVDKIEKEKLKFGDMGYELFYRFSNNTYYSIGVIPKEKVLIVIHLIEYKRNLDKRFKKFRQ